MIIYDTMIFIDKVELLEKFREYFTVDEIITIENIELCINNIINEHK